MSPESERTLRGVQAVFDGRDPESGIGDIMVTLEGVVAATLLTLMDRDHRGAALLLNEALVEGVERRLSLAASRKKG